MKQRKYRLKQRAEQQRETRERIVDAAMALHEEIGPAATTISALAERAGVQRLTVYRHFPGEADILGACSEKWFGQHPPPDPSMVPPGEPAQRTRAILRALYKYYQDTQGMWRSLYRDRGEVDGLEGPMREFDDYLVQVSNALVAASGARRTKRLRTTAGHAVRFSTWQSLASEGLGPAAAAVLACEWIRAVSGG